jgi:anti-sigma factor RsiW
MMNHPEIRDRLNDFADGDLPAAEREEVQKHLAACAECSLEVEAIHGLRAQARALPREIAPPRDLWPEIAARIGVQTGAVDGEIARRRVVGTVFRPPARSIWRRRAGLAAAALALVAFSSAVTTHWIGRRGAPTPEVAALPEARVAEPARAVTALAAFRPTEREYLRTVEDLETVLEARRHRLAPETVATVEENLRIIDRAIWESRVALEADPGNADLPLVLSGVYRKKVELLQAAIQLPAT